MNLARIRIVVEKELREFRANPGVLFPVALLILICMALPFVIVFVPKVIGETIASDQQLRRVVDLALPRMPELAGLSLESTIEAFMFQQFLILFLLAPVMGAVSLGAYSVVGEKLGRTLEPLLTTPLTTVELLVAKVLAALLPALVMEAAGVAGYLAIVGLVAGPGVLDAVLSVRSLILVTMIGPLAALVALQLTVAVSSRMTDVRSAQQTAVLVILPLVAALVGQLAGAFIIPVVGLVLFALALAALWAGLVLVSVAVFERESILTRWR